MDIKKQFMFEPVEKRSGAVHRLYHRINEVRSARELCASYLLLQSLNGDQFYIPAGIFAGWETHANHFLRTSTLRNFDKRSWTRLPHFFLHDSARNEEREMANKSKRMAPPTRRTHKTSADFLRWLRERNDLAQRQTDINTERTGSSKDGN